ncbi:flavoprotein [Amycolatopsis sp. H20-H5]|uniref:flavoprotein n=1 Tax=Amycolatopsis sp. H20-H5 TaxID=3046309 RepID=UPI002DBF538D|nr:flavoprotein [Amycolatopsis sp. H20-H5]MEC3979815.1 flavoprotein [Amycolatopsis sp. H20-H5]
MSERVLYLLLTDAGPAKHIDVMINFALDDGWSVRCIASPAAVEHFLDLDNLERLTGQPVRTGHRRPGQPDLPPADAAIVAPGTYNTINKWAAGIADTYVTVCLAGLTGMGVRMVLLPFVNQGLANNRPFLRSIDELSAMGVRVLLCPGESEPHPPRQGPKIMDTYP